MTTVTKKIDHYNAHDHGYKDTTNRRNGYSHKSVKTTCGDVEIAVPRDRDSSFELQAIPKRTRDLFVDCLYVNIRKDIETRNCAVYVVLGYDVNGVKDILGIPSADGILCTDAENLTVKKVQLNGYRSDFYVIPRELFNAVGYIDIIALAKEVR